MKKSKTLLLVAAMVMVLLGTAVGTLAYFTDSTKAVTNTFTMGTLLDNPENFVLMEHEATDTNKDGIYTLNLSKEVDKNSYVVLPSVELNKDPFIKTNETLKNDAYVFIEVVDKLGTNLHFTVDDEKWTELTGKIGPKEGKVYVLKANNGIVEVGKNLGPVSILTGDKITADNVEIIDAAKQYGGEICFYGYMIQAAGFADYNAAWQGYIGSLK